MNSWKFRRRPIRTKRGASMVAKPVPHGRRLQFIHCAQIDPLIRGINEMGAVRRKSHETPAEPKSAGLL